MARTKYKQYFDTYYNETSHNNIPISTIPLLAEQKYKITLDVLYIYNIFVMPSGCRGIYNITEHTCRYQGNGSAISWIFKGDIGFNGEQFKLEYNFDV